MQELRVLDHGCIYWLCRLNAELICLLAEAQRGGKQAQFAVADIHAGEQTVEFKLLVLNQGF